jgi:hypothetical protein
MVEHFGFFLAYPVVAINGEQSMGSIPLIARHLPFARHLQITRMKSREEFTAIIRLEKVKSYMGMSSSLDQLSCRLLLSNYNIFSFSFLPHSLSFFVSIA